MLKVLFVPGIQYSGETLQDMDRREKAMIAHNQKMDELWQDWERQKKTPMPSMVEWAKERGLIA